MKKQTKKALAFIIAMGICIGSLALFPISSSALYNEQGAYLGSAIPQNPDLPLVITEENLRYDIQTLPDKYFDDEKISHDLSGYNDSLTAEYVIHNPTDTSVSATYAIPMGITASYLPDGKTIADIVKNTNAFDLHVTGNKAYYEFRFTYSPSNEPTLSDEISKLHDNYLPYGEILPETKLTKVIYRIEKNIEKAHLVFEHSDSYDYAFAKSADFSSYPDLSEGVYKEIYFLGNVPKSCDQWKIYDNALGTSQTLNADEVKIVSTEEVTFKDVVLSQRPEDSTISELDWYNAAITRITQNKAHGFNKQNNLQLFDMYYRNLLCWVVYDIEVPAMGDAYCTMKLPLFPSANTSKYPSVYTYDYIFSSKEGDNSRNVTVHISTPYNLTDHNFEGHKTDNGYEITFDDGAYGTLSFDVCKSKSPENMPFELSIFSAFVTITFLVVLLIILGLAVSYLLTIFGSLITAVFYLIIMTALLILCIILTVREARKGRKNKIK